MAEGRASSSTPWMIDVKDTISFNWLCLGLGAVIEKLSIEED